MNVIHQPRTGRQLMVLGDAESIARQARRRAAVHRQRREALQVAAGTTVTLAIVALIMGAPLPAVLAVVVVLFGLGAAAWRQLHDRQELRRRRRVRAQVGPGIGTPRPKGGFSTTRHRSGAPVWVDHRAA